MQNQTLSISPELDLFQPCSNNEYSSAFIFPRNHNIDIRTYDFLFISPKPRLTSRIQRLQFPGGKFNEGNPKTLDNGLTVLLSPNPEEPRFYAEIVTRAGSKHDPETNTGLAHYLEHLLFKGTKNFGTTDFEKEKPLLDKITNLYEQRSKESNQSKRAIIYDEINRISQEAAAIAVPNEMDRIYSDMGGKGINAHTWHEETVYKVDLPANRIDHWAKIEAERFANPVFRLFHTELETVYEEKIVRLITRTGFFTAK